MAFIVFLHGLKSQQKKEPLELGYGSGLMISVPGLRYHAYIMDTPSPVSAN